MSRLRTVSEHTTPSRSTISLTVLNLRSPGPARAKKLALYLERLGSDVLVLPETTPNEGTHHLERCLHDLGYDTLGTPPGGRERGILAASRIEFRILDGLTSQVSIPERSVHFSIGTRPEIEILGLYVPSRDTSNARIDRKRDFISSVLSNLQDGPSIPTFVAGDLNLITRDHLPKYSVFKQFEYAALDTLIEMGYVDLHNHFLPGTPGHTWIGRTGDGYRYDYIFAAAQALGTVASFEILMEPRDLGLTDHYGLRATINVSAGPRMARGRRLGDRLPFFHSEVPGQLPLFD